uniref:transcription factor E4F1-like n=1 Tax=Myxine glutinosa TaxID=7769 RepID=UPI00358F82D5
MNFCFGSDRTALIEEDNDIHKCGRCQTELSSLEAFIQHRVHNLCQRESDEASQHATSPGPTLPSDAHRSPNQHTVFVEEKDEVESVLLYMVKPAGHGNHVTEDNAEKSSVTPALFMTSDGRYICHVCQKTFKTEIILKTHMSTHSKRKPFRCKICDIQFRMKGSLERHNRRHTGERPYVCKQCGLAFRESGALTRHLKSRMPCYKRPFYRQLSFWTMQGQNTQYTTGKTERMFSVVEKPADGAADAVLQVLGDSAGKDLAILPQPLGLCNKTAKQDQKEDEEAGKSAREVEVGQTGSTLEQSNEELTKREVSGNEQATSAVRATGSTHTQESSLVAGEDVGVDKIVTTGTTIEVVPGSETQIHCANNANNVTTQDTYKACEECLPQCGYTAGKRRIGEEQLLFTAH